MGAISFISLKLHEMVMAYLALFILEPHLLSGRAYTGFIFYVHVEVFDAEFVLGFQALFGFVFIARLKTGIS